MAQFNGIKNVEVLQKALQRTQNAQKAGLASAQARRRREVEADPVAFTIWARQCGFRTASEAAGFTARYIKGGTSAALQGPAPKPEPRHAVPTFAPFAKLSHEEG